MIVNRIVIHKYCFLGLMVFLLLNIPVFSAIKTETSLKIEKNFVQVKTVFKNETKSPYYILLNKWGFGCGLKDGILFPTRNYNSNYLFFIKKDWLLNREIIYEYNFVTPPIETNPIFLKVSGRSNVVLKYLLKFDSKVVVPSCFKDEKVLVAYTYIDELAFKSTKDYLNKYVLFQNKTLILNNFKTSFPFIDCTKIDRNYFNYFNYTNNSIDVIDKSKSSIFQSIAKFLTRREFVYLSY